MLRTILTYGLIAGVIVGTPLIGITIATQGEPLPYGTAIGYLTMLVALTTVFVAVKRQRDVVQGGVIRFWPALGMGLGISLVAAVIYVIAWEIAQQLVPVDFMEIFTRIYVEEAQAKGASAAEIARLKAEMAAFKVQYANPLIRIPITLAEILQVGVLVSLVSAGLLSNRRFLPARRNAEA